MDNVNTENLLYVDDKDLKETKLKTILNLPFEFNYGEDRETFLGQMDISEDDFEDFVYFVSKNANVFRIKNIFDLNPNATFNISLYISGQYNHMHFGGWLRGKFDKDDIIMSNDNGNFDIILKLDDLDIYVTNEYYDDLYEYVPELRAKELFLSFYDDVFSNYYENAKRNAIGNYEYAVVEDDKIIRLCWDKEEADLFIEEETEEGNEGLTIIEIDSTSVDEYEYNLREHDYNDYNDYLTDLYKNVE